MTSDINDYYFILFYLIPYISFTFSSINSLEMSFINIYLHMKIRHVHRPKTPNIYKNYLMKLINMNDEDNIVDQEQFTYNYGC